MRQLAQNGSPSARLGELSVSSGASARRRTPSPAIREGDLAVRLRHEVYPMENPARRFDGSANLRRESGVRRQQPGNW
jgi:hypothetical protein